VGVFDNAQGDLGGVRIANLSRRRSGGKNKN